MRYSLNHSWKFQSWCTAYMIGLSQFTMILSVEIVNLVVLLTSPSVMDTVMNFLALVIIADFDDYMFAVVSDGPIEKLITDGEFDFSYIEGKTNMRTLKDITRVETTSSFLARFKVEGNKLVYSTDVSGTGTHEQFPAAADDKDDGVVATKANE